MAHFFKYGNRPLHAGTPEAKERSERDERMRQAGLKAGNTQDRPSAAQSSEAKERRLKDLAQQKMFRAIAKKNAINKAKNK